MRFILYNSWVKLLTSLISRALELSRETADENKKIKERRDARTNEVSSSSKVHTATLAANPVVPENIKRLNSSKTVGGRSFAEITKAASSGTTKKSNMFLQDLNGHKVSYVPHFLYLVGQY